MVGVADIIQQAMTGTPSCYCNLIPRWFGNEAVA